VFELASVLCNNGFPFKMQATQDTSTHLFSALSSFCKLGQESQMLSKWHRLN